MHPFHAGLADYLPLLIFIAIWWISSKKKKSVQRRPDGTSPARPPRRGDGLRLREILEQILGGEAEMPRPRPTPAGTVRPTAPPVGPPARSRPDLEGGSVLQKTDETPPTGAPPQRTAPVAGPAVTRGPGPVRRMGCGPSISGKINRRALRKAVVWSEILAPPVSMRK